MPFTTCPIIEVDEVCKEKTFTIFLYPLQITIGSNFWLFGLTKISSSLEDEQIRPIAFTS